VAGVYRYVRSEDKLMGLILEMNLEGSSNIIIVI